MLPKINFSKYFFINLIILLIPVNFIIGNLLLNLNIIILIISVFFFFGLAVFKIKLNNIDKLILLLFLYIFLNGLINNFLDSNSLPSKNLILIKTIAYCRYLFLYFVVRFLVIKNLINLKYLFFFYGFSALFVSADILIQYITGVDLFGFSAEVSDAGTERRLSGPFGDEYIAGSFIQRFFIFFPYFFLIFFRFKNKLLFQSIFLLTLIVSLLGTLLSGNRVPLIMSLIILILLFIFEKEFRKTLVSSFLILIICAFYLIKSNENYNVHLKQLVKNSYQLSTYLQKKITAKEVVVLENSYVKEMETGFLTWGQNKFFGGGVKSFYFNCTTIKSSAMSRYGGTNCNSHPHNFYLEIGAILGLFGFALLISIFLLTCFFSLKKVFSPKIVIEQKRLLVPFLIVFIVEIFPLKTTGSFFSTSNATFLFIIISYIVSLVDKKKEDYIEKK